MIDNCGMPWAIGVTGLVILLIEIWLIISHISINKITSPVTPIAQGIPQLSIIALIPQLFDFSELLRSNLSIFPTGSIND